MGLALEDTRLPVESMGHRKIPVQGCSSAVLLTRGETKNSSHIVSDHQRLNSLLQKGKEDKVSAQENPGCQLINGPAKKNSASVSWPGKSPCRDRSAVSSRQAPCLQQSQFTLGQPTSSAQSTWGSWVAVIASLEGCVALELSASL